MSCCSGGDSPALTDIAKLVYDTSITDKIINVKFDHGLGDCVHFIAYCQTLKDIYNITVNIHAEGNKQQLFDAAGIARCAEESASYHLWSYPPDFNYPGEQYIGDGAKIYGNILLKTDVERREFFNHLCSLNLEHILPSLETEQHQQYIADKLKYLPEPFVLLHLWGTNLADYKNINNHEEVYDALLNSFDGTLILLDWDQRAKQTNHGRIRHSDKDLGIGAGDFATLSALYSHAQQSGGIMVGVDSGPLHSTALHPIPALAVLHHHYPSAVCLPSHKQVCMTRNADSYKPANIIRRKLWNIVEYPGAIPSAIEIAKHANRLMIYKNGFETMFAQWVDDGLYQSTNLCSRADRNVTMRALFNWVNVSFDKPNIIETGCIRSPEDWSAGYSTYLFAAYVNTFGGFLTSVDVNKTNLQFAANEIARSGWQGNFNFVTSDSVKFLNSYDKLIDVLYLDSLDVEHPQHAEYGLQEIQAAEKNLYKESIVVFDDTCFRNGNWIGKGALGVPYLLNKDWQILSLGYQVVLIK